MRTRSFVKPKLDWPSLLNYVRRLGCSTCQTKPPCTAFSVGSTRQRWSRPWVMASHGWSSSLAESRPWQWRPGSRRECHAPLRTVWSIEVSIRPGVTALTCIGAIPSARASTTDNMAVRIGVPGQGRDYRRSEATVIDPWGIQRWAYCTT
jgi:hypothetical protein